MTDRSMSGLPLYTECAAPSRPGIWMAPDKSNPAARFGNAAHLLMQWSLMGQLVDIGAAVAKEKVAPADVDRLGRLWATLDGWTRDTRKIGWRPEVALAYDPVTGVGRELGQCIERKYEEHGCLPSELPGTADVLCLDGDCAVVYDLKTGRSEAASYRWQMRGLGLAAARRYQVSRARIVVVKANEVEVDDSWREELDADDLDQAGEVVRVAWQSEGVARPGAHCEAHYCRAREKCAAFRAWRAA